MIVRVLEQEISISSIVLDESDQRVPYLTCTSEGEVRGIEGTTRDFLATEKIVRLVLDDGRVFPVLAMLAGDELTCSPTELPSDQGARTHDYGGSWSMPWE